MRTGISNLPLHGGRCPKWLFPRMRDLSGAIIEAIAMEYGGNEVLRRLSDPYFFQSLGCVVAFDWHSSGLTTTLCGALKEGVDPQRTGIAVLGGKGKTSKKTPQEIEGLAEKFSIKSRQIEILKYSSRMAAKVDGSCVQDGYQLYHHTFIVSERGEWCVVQQGMNPVNNYARRYHWLSEALISFVEDPQTAICCDVTGRVMNMVAEESEESRKASVDLVKEDPNRLARFFSGGQSLLTDFWGLDFPRLDMKRGHYIPLMNKRNLDTLKKAYEIQPHDYEELLAIGGVGPKTIRSLALIGQVIYGAEPSWKDPAKFSFAHGGKDGIPFPVDRETYDSSIEILKVGIQEAKMGAKDRMNAMERLGKLF